MERWGAVEAEFAERYGVLDLFTAFDGTPNGWRKFTALVRYIPLDSPIWPNPELPDPVASDPIAEARRKLDRMAGRPEPKRTMSLDDWVAEGG